MKKRNLSTLWKNKTRSYSAQAAITSIIIHSLLILFAGSIVTVRYVQKQRAELIARTESRPKLERKKLQAPVARVEQLQQRSLTSKLVSKKVSFTNPKFILPDTGKIGSFKAQKLSLPGANAGRALSSLSRAPGIGPSRIDFFGVRAEGEKAVFIIDASAAMLDDRTGGPATYEYIKGELSKIVSELKPTMLFNLIFYDQQRVYMFRPNLVPATRDTASALTAWIQAVNSDPAQAGLLTNQHNYEAPTSYETAVGSDAQGWFLALQAALEQQPDTVMILGSGWGHHHISSEKATRLLDYAMWELLVGNVVSGAPALTSDRKLRDDLLKEACTAIQQDEKLRTAKTVPAGFVRDIAQYVEYSKTQVLEHLESVCQAGYGDRGLSKPSIHFVCLTESANQVVAGATLRYLWALTGRFNGKLEFLRRDHALTAIAESDIPPAAEVSGSGSIALPVKFFSIEGTGSRVAFVLDASPDMLAEENGGLVSYGFIKDQIQKCVEGIQTGAQFNVILHDGQQLALFKPEMVPATTENIAALREWLQPVNSDLSNSGLPESLVSRASLTNYGTVVGTDSSGWLRALQAAMEQKSDVVFMIGSGWVDQPINREKGRKLLDFSVWNSWGSGSGTAGSAGETEVTEEIDENGDVTTTSTTTGGSSGSTSLGTITGMQQDKKQRDALLKEALKAIAKEDQLRKAEGGAQPFVRDILSYMRYTSPQISDHLNAVVQSKYMTGGVITKPAVNYVCLVPAQDENSSAGTDRNLRKLTGDYGGSLILFRGANSIDEIREVNRSLELTE